MSYDADALYALLPAIHRQRDAEQGEPLEALLAVVADQVVLLEENLAQLYDDQFVETAAPWALPYIGDLLGITGLPPVGRDGLDPRAEVAHTIAYRRRKGTAAVLEQLARDATGWPARAVEFFQLIATTQHVNHVRPENTSFVSVRDASRLEHLGTAFERLAGSVDLPHFADVRRLPRRDGAPGAPLTPPGGTLDPALDAPPLAGVGRYGIPNVGLFLWRLRAQPLTRSEAKRLDAVRFRFDPLGTDITLFNRPRTEEEITHLAEPANVPGRISRRQLARDLASADDEADGYYGRSLRIETVDSGYTLDPAAVPRDDVEVCDLSDWSHTPANVVAVDPALGRIKFRDPQTKTVLVTFHHGAAASLGGGEYDRGVSFDDRQRKVIAIAKVGPIKTIQAGLDALLAESPEGGVIEIEDSGRYEEILTVPQFEHLEIRAADKWRPTIVLKAPLALRGKQFGEVTLSGLLLTGEPVSSSDPLRTLRIEHCTLVPGIALDEHGAPTRPGDASLVVSSSDTKLTIERSIVGGLRVADDAEATITDSIVDATSETGVAYAAEDGAGPGGSLRIENSTVIGKVHAMVLELVSNSILLGELGPADAWAAPVMAKKRQEGCIRFSYLPANARVPRRYRCQPERDGGGLHVRPLLDAARYGDPEYCRLSLKCPDAIRRGGDDDAEMGVYHHLAQPQREAHLSARLEEHLRFGLEAGIIYAT